MLYLNKFKRVDFLVVGHQICRDFRIASIKHQKRKLKFWQPSNKAQRWEQFERSFQFDSVSKTACREFESLYPCQMKSLQSLDTSWIAGFSFCKNYCLVFLFFDIYCIIFYLFSAVFTPIVIFIVIFLGTDFAIHYTEIIFKYTSSRSSSKSATKSANGFKSLFTAYCSSAL